VCADYRDTWAGWSAAFRWVYALHLALLRLSMKQRLGVLYYIWSSEKTIKSGKLGSSITVWSNRTWVTSEILKIRYALDAR